MFKEKVRQQTFSQIFTIIFWAPGYYKSQFRSIFSSSIQYTLNKSTNYCTLELMAMDENLL